MNTLYKQLRVNNSDTYNGEGDHQNYYSGDKEELPQGSGPKWQVSKKFPPFAK